VTALKGRGKGAGSVKGALPFGTSSPLGFAMFDATRNEGARQIRDLAREITRIIGAHGPRKLEVTDWQRADGDHHWELEFKIDGASFPLRVPDEFLQQFGGDYSVRAAATECIVSQIGRHLDGG
jgi:hypothetical protein